MFREYAKIAAIEALLSKPNAPFSVRGLAHEAKISPAAAGKALELMEKEGIAKKETVGRSYQFKANLENPLCRQWKILFSVDRIAKAKIVGKTLKAVPDAISILLYGSKARGTDDEKSDFDIIVVCHRKEKADLSFVKDLGKDSNFTVLSMHEWKEKAQKEKAFYENVIYDSTVLYGHRPVVL